MFTANNSETATPVWAVTPAALEAWEVDHAGHLAAWVKTSNFKAESGRVLLLPNSSGGVEGVLLGLGTGDDPFLFGALLNVLPLGDYRLAEGAPIDLSLATLGWALGAYRFDRYVAKGEESKECARLVLPAGVDGEEISRLAQAIFYVRDLVNTPAADMGPHELEQEVRSLASAHQADVTVIEGDDLLDQNYPMVHAVGRAAASEAAPRLIDLRWGANGPKITLVGKGVCFDTGGLNIKTGNYMSIMKKDMGGAAHVMALGKLIMEASLPCQLRILIPAVENAIDGNAFRPGDVLESRKGLTVEISNTDAEGRLVLGDALAEADSEAPDLLIDMATLTGAARVALGPHLPPFFTDDEKLATSISQAAQQVNDPLWRLPLWNGYDAMLDSKIANVNHAAESPFAGSITAALFLRRFVEEAKSWVHLDVYAWNPSARAGRPVGGEAQTIRALFEVIKTRCAN
ncbi:MAG: leucyl aminopeptidase family protein [Parvibaculaceae bacterium]|nr:leucyl aminopeptidase family protein [Parvibaculaceae bacterium]